MLAKCLTQRFVAAQEMVIQQNEPGHEMYFVVQGMLDVLVQMSAGAEEHMVMATIREGSFFGERGLLEGTTRSYSVMAITLTELLVLTRTDFQQIVGSEPAILEMFKRNVFKKIYEEIHFRRNALMTTTTTVVDAARMPWLAAALQSSALPPAEKEEEEGTMKQDAVMFMQRHAQNEELQHIHNKNEQQGGGGYVREEHHDHQQHPPQHIRHHQHPHDAEEAATRADAGGPSEEEAGPSEEEDERVEQ